MIESLLLGSGNRKKRDELARALAGAGLGGVRILTPADLIPPPAEPVEDADTFLGNARLKALEYARASGLLTLADDSGLEVDALGGAPGVLSARFAGPEADDAANVRELLARLEGVPAAERGARFRCALVLADPERTLEEAEGRVEGAILETPRGAGGFGYDPVFLDPASGRVFAELSPEEKAARSHRGEALRALLPGLCARLRGGPA